MTTPDLFRESDWAIKRGQRYLERSEKLSSYAQKIIEETSELLNEIALQTVRSGEQAK